MLIRDCFEEDSLKARLTLAPSRFPAVLLVVLMMAISGCNSGRGGADVMAKVDGKKIYRTDVDKYYANQTAGSEQQPVGEQATSLRLSILNELIETEILMRRAEKLGLLATGEEVDRKRLARQRAYPRDGLVDFSRRHIGRTKRSQPARI